MVETVSSLEIKDSRSIDYPRPQFRREHWLDLNGEWQFAFDDAEEGEENGWYQNAGALPDKILVPYAYQSKKSGIHTNVHHDVVWYKRSFFWEKEVQKEYILHFEASDYHTKVWVNGQYIGDHQGGHTPFSFPISRAMKDGENTIAVKVEDRNSVEQPVGKQSWKSDNFLCWYSRTTGIWQSVWIEELSPLHIEDIKMTPRIEESKLNVDARLPRHNETVYLEAEVSYKGEWINTVGSWIKPNQTLASFAINVESDEADFRVFYWTPDNPQLYDITFTLYSESKQIDRVQSYFGMRNIEVKNENVLLNREAFYQKLILDQGYYPDSLMTADYEQMKSDLTKIKDMGFNGVRRHQTIADRRYMYLCDVLGLVMWAEMPSFYRFSNQSMDSFLSESRQMVLKHYNHPSVIVYTLMNESWGVNEIYHSTEQQNFVNALYFQTKALDSSRLVVGNDGWEHTMTDILTIHDYNSDSADLKASYSDKSNYVNGSPSKTSRKQNFASNYTYTDQPIIMSEFGGIAFGEKTNEQDWGYGTRPQSEEEVLQRFEDLTKTVMEIDSMQGFCYTQLTDVEQEVNGLLDHNHEEKFDLKRIKSILSTKRSNGFVFE
ncbi:glycoside hydrolase family 2 protein [Halobacillus sp. Marseille-Q1614]|uniref:glycoside hydrolase family 2 protein n=1 Tax=Halobacillus sp. Marseille-Q1614 TaxID=2709134 RepID=UPI0015700C45|nr:sugar-binding domain-containing protein [Halobacillus sp. Marseille-Q1614]